MQSTFFVDCFTKELMKFLIAVIVFAASAIILILLFQNKGIDYYKTKAEEQKLAKQIKKLRKENDDLKKEIYLLKNDPFYLEKYARDTFDLAASNEITIKFDE